MNEFKTTVLFDLPVHKITQFSVYGETFDFNPFDFDPGEDGPELNSSYYRGKLADLLYRVYCEADKIMPISYNGKYFSENQLKRLAIGLSRVDVYHTENIKHQKYKKDKFYWYFDCIFNDIKNIQNISVLGSILNYKLAVSPLGTTKKGEANYHFYHLLINDLCTLNDKRQTFFHEIIHAIDASIKLSVNEDDNYLCEHNVHNFAYVLSTLKLKFRE